MMKKDHKEKVDILEEDRKNDMMHQDPTRKYDQPGSEPLGTPDQRNEEKGHDRKE